MVVWRCRGGGRGVGAVRVVVVVGAGYPAWGCCFRAGGAAGDECGGARPRPACGSSCLVPLLG